jgi:hypothetical protein
VRATCAAAPGLSLSQLKGALPKAYRMFSKEAEELAARWCLSGELFSFKRGKLALFFAQDPMAHLDDILPSQIAHEALEKQALAELVIQLAPGHALVLDIWLKRAVLRGLVFQHAARAPSRKKRYGSEPDVESSLAAVLKALRSALPGTDARGISRERVAEALLRELGLSASNISLLKSNERTTARPSSDASQAGETETFLASVTRAAAEAPVAMQEGAPFESFTRGHTDAPAP